MSHSNGWKIASTTLLVSIVAAGCLDDSTVDVAGQRAQQQADTSSGEADAGAQGDLFGADTGVTTSSGSDAGLDTAIPTPDSGQPVDTGHPVDTGQQDTGALQDTSASEDAGDDLGGSDVESDTGPDIDPEPTYETIRFVAFGDWGTYPSTISKAADAMWAHCQVAGCDFALGLGDNFYDDGINPDLGLNDPQFEDKFEEPFAQWDISFYMTLGNHDYRGDVDAQVEYSEVHPFWEMSARYYELVAGGVHFFGIDTNANYTEQSAWLLEGMSTTDLPFRIGFAHHVWRSEGVHGDGSGARRDLQEWGMCDYADVFIAGHDHDIQRLPPECGVQLIVSGGSVTTRTIDAVNTTTSFASVEKGFAWFEVTNDEITVEFHAVDDNEVLHSARFPRRDRTLDCSADDYCALGCDDDPDCAGLDCTDNDVCEPRCPADPDCFRGCGCDYNQGICEPLERDSAVRCGCDPMCRGANRACAGDGHCDSWCPVGVDPDC